MLSGNGRKPNEKVEEEVSSSESLPLVIQKSSMTEAFHKNMFTPSLLTKFSIIHRQF